MSAAHRAPDECGVQPRLNGSRFGITHLMGRVSQ